MQKLLLTVMFTVSLVLVRGQDYVQWQKAEFEFSSDREYGNAIYEVREFSATFTSPTGRTYKVPGFWDGGRSWKVRYLPQEVGNWQYQTTCSDAENSGLHNQQSAFTVVGHAGDSPLQRHGAVKTSKGQYHFAHDDGTPFFWTACTAWNGALKSTDEEWDHYLASRVEQGYNTIQYVTTEWRGCAQSADGLTAISGSGRIEIHPEFFRRIDQKTDEINEQGLLAAPVLLWALGVGDGRHLSPGYHLPKPEAILLARYIVARLQGNHVVYLLGGDGDYIREYEDRWKFIGSQVFGDIHHAPVTLHPRGHRWVGEVYQDETWLDVVSYQSSHSNKQGTVDWITKGPMTKNWHLLPPKPLINMEPNYEEIRFAISAEDVRNASFWSLFATPISGITYGANGIWPWLQVEGDTIENHHNPEDQFYSTWRESVEFPGSKQVGLLAQYLQAFDWPSLRPMPEILMDQPGDESFNHFISVVGNDDLSVVLAYVPRGDTVKLRPTDRHTYQVVWYNPRNGEQKMEDAGLRAAQLSLIPPDDSDWLLVLKKM